MQLIQIKRNQYYEQFVHLYQSSFPPEEQNPLSVMFMYRNNINSFFMPFIDNELRIFEIKITIKSVALIN